MPLRIAPFETTSPVPTVKLPLFSTTELPEATIILDATATMPPLLMTRELPQPGRSCLYASDLPMKRLP